MTRGTELLLLATIVCLALGGVLASPVLIGVGAGLGRWAWVRADRDELVRRFG